MGIIKLQPETMIIKGVVVKGERPQYKMSPGGVEVAVEHTLLSKMANTFDVLNLLPRVSVDGQKISVFGKGAPIVYINNKRVHDNNEIVNITPDNIKSISVITSPGAEYDAEVESVIRIRTKERHANGFSLRADALGKYNKWISDYELINARYQTRKFEIANSLWTRDYHVGEDNHLNTDINLPDKHYHNDQHFNLDTNNRFLSEYLSADCSLNDSNSIILIPEPVIVVPFKPANVPFCRGVRLALLFPGLSSTSQKTGWFPTKPASLDCMSFICSVLSLFLFFSINKENLFRFSLASFEIFFINEELLF
jgi:hypothetical protein